MPNSNTSYCINLSYIDYVFVPTDGNWEIPFESIEELSYLGAGAQGVVFGGRLQGEMVAIKKVREKEETNIKHLRKLNHENIGELPIFRYLSQNKLIKIVGEFDEIFYFKNREGCMLRVNVFII